MENVLLLNSNKPATFSFNVEISGVDQTKPIIVRLCILAENIMYCFSAVRENEIGTSFIVDIPALPHVPKTTHPFKIEVIADGYYFEAMHGAVNIVGDPLASVTPVIPTVKIDSERKPVVLTQEDVRQLKDSEKSIKQLAEEAMSKMKTRADNIQTTTTKKEEKLTNIPNQIITTPSNIKTDVVKNDMVLQEELKDKGDKNKEIKDFLKSLNQTKPIELKEVPIKSKLFKKGNIVDR